MRIPFLPCFPAFTLLFGEQTLKNAELGSNILKQALHAEVHSSFNLIWWYHSGQSHDSEDKQQVASLKVLPL